MSATRRTGYRGAPLQHVDSFPLRGEDSPSHSAAPSRAHTPPPAPPLAVPPSPTSSSDRTAAADDARGGGGGEETLRGRKVEEAGDELGRAEKGEAGAERDTDMRKRGGEKGKVTGEAGGEGERVSAEERQWKGDVVSWDSEDDPANPKNWAFNYRYLIVALLGMTTMSSTFASSVFASALPFIADDYGISEEVATLGVSLFVAGYIAGPVVFSSVSEVYGRKIGVFTGVFIFICLSAGTAVSKDIQSIMITRFWAGFGASAPPAVVGGALADLFDARERATAVVFYSLAIVAGPCIGPVIGSAVSDSFLGWRWTEYLTVILASTVGLLGLLFVPETFAPVILTRKAAALRLKTKRWALHSKHEENDFSLKHFAEKTLTRPIRLLVSEPMVFAICLYNSFTYGILYMLFSAVPIVFEQNHGWTPVQGSLPFLAVLVGTLVAAAFNWWYSAHVFAPYLDKHGSAPPELRLVPMMVGGVLFPVGFFFLGWLPLAGKIVGCGLIGVSFLLIFQAGINFTDLLDAYTIYAASAVAANTFLRSIFAAALPLVARPLYLNLGVGRACSLLGGIAAGLMVVPFVFYKYGKRLRGMSKFAKGD
ncbi:hypothetical protein JCM8097_004737 [Rhodosporidiobolus ruineniae]